MDVLCASTAGVTNEPLMLQLQADAIGAPVEAAGADATVLGAAALAAVGSGMVSSLSELTEMLPADRKVEPERDAEVALVRARGLEGLRRGHQGPRPELSRPRAENHEGRACGRAPVKHWPVTVRRRA